MNLRKDNKTKQYQIHRLVAIAFLPNENNYPFVNHKDENPSNNRVDNLEWCTPKYNVNYGTARERLSKALKGKRSGEKHPMYGKQHKDETRQKISKTKKNDIKNKKENHPKAKMVAQFKNGKIIKIFLNY